jgi:hypothetical protein
MGPEMTCCPSRLGCALAKISSVSCFRPCTTPAHDRTEQRGCSSHVLLLALSWGKQALAQVADTRSTTLALRSGVARTGFHMHWHGAASLVHASVQSISYMA